MHARTRLAGVLLASVVAAAGSAEAGPGTARDRIVAQANCAYGPNTCVQGFVWREAFGGDVVCVTPEVRNQTRADNAQAAARRSPTGGAYGPDTCLSGFVWRDAAQNDHVCVTPETRAQAAQDNGQAAARLACR